MKENNTNTKAAPATQGAVHVTVVELLRLAQSTDWLVLEREAASLWYREHGDVKTANMLGARACRDRSLVWALKKIAATAPAFAIVPLDADQARRVQ